MSSAASAEIPRDVPANRVVDFDFYNIPGAAEDFHIPWKKLQDDTAPHSMAWTTANGGHWIATRAQAIQTVIADFERFSSYRMTIPPGTDRSSRWDVLPISLDPPEHRPYRALLNSGLSPKVVNARAEQIREFAISLIEAIRPRRGCDFVADYAEEFPIRMVFMIMDLPFEEKPRMMALVNQITMPDGSMTIAQIVDGFSDFLRPFIQERKGGTGTDLISHICNGRIGDRAITEQESVQMCVQTFAAGLESVRNALSFIMVRLAQDPETRRALTANPAAVPGAINEMLRRYSAMIVSREVIADIEFDGVTLRKGDLIACPVQLVGLDERENACPMGFDLNRGKMVSIPFGTGPHFCAGRWLADLELKVTVQEWLARIPEFEVEPGATITYSPGILGAVDSLPLRW